MNKLLTIAILFAYTGIFAQRTTLPNTATQSPSNKNLNNLNGQVIQDRLVVNDSAWFNGVQNVFPNGNVGIGTTTPQAKLHVSSNDTPSVAIAHFENNLGTAIMTLHSHADSSVIYYMQTGAYSAGIGLEGITKKLMILDGLGSVAIEIDTNNNVTIPDLAGSAQKIVTALGDGTLDTINGTLFTIDAADNMYGGTGALSALTSGSSNFVAGISAGNTITTGSSNVIIGNEANAADTTETGVVIGRLSSISGPGAIAIGVTSTADNGGLAVGLTAIAASGSVSLGSGSGSAYTNSVSIGNGAATTAVNQFVSGSDAGQINSVYFGNGVTSTVAIDYSINGTGGAGTNNAAGDVIIAAGKSTGNATPGEVVFQTAMVGASGTTAQTLSSAGKFDASTTAGQTRFFLYDVDNGTLERVTVGAADSGGAGFKVLRIPN